MFLDSPVETWAAAAQADDAPLLWRPANLWTAFLIGGAVSVVALSQGAAEWMRRREEEKDPWQRLRVVRPDGAQPILADSRPDGASGDNGKR